MGGGTDAVTAYPVQRPDGQWAILLVNRDLAKAHDVTVQFTTDSGTRYFSGAVTQIQFPSGAQSYVWVPNGVRSKAKPDLGPATSTQPGGANQTDVLPAGSVTVLRGRIERYYLANSTTTRCSFRRVRCFTSGVHDGHGWVHHWHQTGSAHDLSKTARQGAIQIPLAFEHRFERGF